MVINSIIPITVDILRDSFNFLSLILNDHVKWMYMLTIKMISLSLQITNMSDVDRFDMHTASLGNRDGLISAQVTT